MDSLRNPLRWRDLAAVVLPRRNNAPRLLLRHLHISESVSEPGLFWTDEETNAYLFLIGEAIRNKAWRTLKLPARGSIKSHAEYRKGQLPEYPLGRLACSESHEHLMDCYRLEHVSAKGTDAWTAEHASAHHAWLEYLDTRGNEELMDVLPFDEGGSCPVQYEADYGGHSYYLRYRSAGV